MVRLPRPALLLSVSLALAAAPSFAATPDWVATGGRSPRFPAERTLTAFALSDTAPDPLASAKAQAAANLARTLSVRIESQLTDQMSVKGKQERQDINALTRASTDVRLSGLTYETFLDGKRAYVLAILERGPAAKEERHLRDQALASAQERLAVCRAKPAAEALRACLGVRTSVADALQHETLARAIDRAAPDAGVEKSLLEVQSLAAARSRELLDKPQNNLREAVETLAFQLDQQGVVKAKWTFTPFTYRTSVYPSLFGRAVATELERALAAAIVDAGDGEIVFRGTTMDEEDVVRLLVVARETLGGRTIASAEAVVPKKAIPPELPLMPPNLLQALRDQKILAVGEEVPGALRVELFTNKQDANSSQVFTEKEELKLFVRVNKPCYVRLVYLLQSGKKVPIAQAWYIKEGDVNKLVEFPDTFEIASPFGSEHIQAAAFSDKPEALATRKETIEGTEYDVVTDGTEALVRHRGFTKKVKTESADTFVTLTTMPR